MSFQDVVNKITIHTPAVKFAGYKIDLSFNDQIRADIVKS